MRSRSVSVTGATGFVGSHVVEALVREGWDVRAIVREGNRRPVPRGTRVVESSLEAAALTAACAGSDVVIHGAALIRARDDATFAAVNVDGTRAAAAAARAAGARLVLLSSLAAGGTGTPEHPRRESDPSQPLNAYGRSKLAAERVLRETPGLAWTILRPCAVYGPRDRGFLPIFRMAKRGLFFVPTRHDTAFTLIHVDDVVGAVLRAAEAVSAIGETFFVGHPSPRKGTELFQLAAETQGRRFTPRFLPAALVGAAARAGDLAWTIGIRPLIDSGRFAELRAEGFVCSVEHARDTLGFTAQTDLPEGVAATARWYEREGWL
jgi:nucleoside-diphosphate-sugar epimerase